MADRVTLRVPRAVAHYGPVPARRPPLAEGGMVELRDADGRSIAVSIGAVVQRNYSRTAPGTCEDNGLRVFVKQFVDRRGRHLRDVFDSELAGMAAGRLLFDGVRVPAVVGTSDADLVVAYEWIEAEPPDETLRRDPAAFDEAFPRFLDAMASMVAAAGSSPAAAAILPEATSGNAVCFKGLEIRNLAMTPTGEVIAFDLGRPYAGTASEQVTRIVVSVALLNWGRPLRRFWSGPPLGPLAAAEHRFAADLDVALLRRRARRELRNRVEDGQAATRGAAAARAAALRLIGGRYVRALERRWRPGFVPERTSPTPDPS